MRRVIVRVDQQADGWSVAVRTRDDTGEPVDLVPPYTMPWTVLGDRRVPVVPDDRLPEVPDDDPGGRIARHRLVCAGDHDELSALLRPIGSGAPGGDDVACYGGWLFECLLAPAWEAIRKHPDVVRYNAVEIALRWPVLETALHRLVWEAMYDGEVPLAGHSVVVAITRLVPAAPVELKTLTEVPKVLFATGVALSDPTIRPGAMFMGLLRGLDADGRCRARAVQAVSDDKLREACTSFQPDVVHLVAHGVLLPDGRGALMLPGESGQLEPTDATALFAAVSAGGRPRAVVLSACNSASAGETLDGVVEASPLAAELVAAGIPVVSAMAGEVSESACRLYTRKLAEALHDGQPVALAAAHGRRAALVGSPGPRTDINWALPALYLAEDLDPTQAMVDATSSRALVGLANHLRLRKEPLFVGRSDAIDAADRMVEPGATDGVLAVLAKGDTSGLGGTRLLREIGWRLLRAGHLPLMVGPFSKSGDRPDTARKLLYQLLLKVQAALTYLDLPPFIPELVRFALPADEATRLAAEVAEAIERGQVGAARATVNLAAKRVVLKGTDDLSVAEVRDLLCADLASLADRTADWGGHFGKRTRVVVLCDDIHRWDSTGPELSGLDCLLGMLEPNGLGSVHRPAPVVLTGSKTLAGEALSTWLSNVTSGFLSLELGTLSEADAVIGYQWVLLHPWKDRPAEGSQRFGYVYTAVPNRVRQWEKTLRAPELSLPTAVESTLYLLAWSAVNDDTCRSDNDEQAWHDYANQNPGSQW